MGGDDWVGGVDVSAEVPADEAPPVRSAKVLCGAVGSDKGKTVGGDGADNSDATIVRISVSSRSDNMVEDF